MYKFFSKLFYAFNGWKIEGAIPPGIKKCVLVAAPHTSNWDFLYGSCGWTLFGLKVKYLIKKEWFRFPFTGLMKSLGGIPVDRSKNTYLVDAMVELVNNREEIIVLMTPEGTRKRVDKWRTGFYHLAMKSHIPIVLGKVNYATKMATIGPAFMPSGNVEQDFIFIREFYKDAVGRVPENFSVDAIRP